VKCHQCDHAAMFGAGPKGEIPVCLDCWHKFQNATAMQFLMAAAAANQAADDMDAMMPIGLTGGRIPVAALANALAKGSSVTNHINISNSNVGVVNTGDVDRINAAITLSQKSDVAGVGLQIKALTEEIIKSKEAKKVDKQELVDLVEALATEVVGTRKKPVILSLLTAIEERAKGFSAIYAAAQTLSSLAQAIFGSP
jgi:hypothetical protein